ncbi:hypothetical protein J3A83DRAFT_4084310 [Scleroderma citrinum]
MVGVDLQDQVYHEAIPVPSCNSLFACTNDKAEFWSVFENVMLKDITPAGYGLLPHELKADSSNSTLEFVSVGQHGAKSITVSLADPVWVKHARTWCQGLVVLTLFEISSYFDN